MTLAVERVGRVLNRTADSGWQKLARHIDNRGGFKSFPARVTTHREDKGPQRKNNKRRGEEGKGS